MDAVGLSYRLQGLALQAQGFRSRRVPTASGRIHLYDAPGRGTLPPVLVLHGVSACAAQYEPVLRRVRRWSRRVIALDAPGHGRSDTPPDWSPPRLQDAMAQALDAVLDEPVLVYGNSMGGFGAVRFAQARPERVRGLALTSPGGAPMDAQALADFVGRFSFQGARDAVVFLERLFGERRWTSRLIAGGVRAQMRRVQPLLDGLLPEHLFSPADLAQLAMPILLQWGERDRLLPDAHQAFFREHLPAHTFDAPPDFCHCPNLDRPADLAQRLHTWAASLERG